jgi:hypothetical protein
MTAKELESKAWRLVEMAKVAGDKARRKVLMREAFDLPAGRQRIVEAQRKR